MQPDPLRCTECGGEMEIGYIADHTEYGCVQQVWVKEPPQKNWIGGLKIKRENVRKVDTNRCKSCGFLKSYAR
jgi:hypothetical protein